MPGISGETDLVVDDNVNGAVGGVVRQVGQVEGLENNALTAEGSVTVEQHGHDFLALTVSPVELLCTGLALDNWVAGLQVRGVGNHSQTDVLVGDTVETLDVGSQVVFHVTRTLKLQT